MMGMYLQNDTSLFFNPKFKWIQINTSKQEY